MANDLVQRQASPPGLRTRCKRGRENETKTAGHIARLMAHYWAANENPKLRAALASDWLEDLAEFHEAIIAEACRDWRQQPGGRRPTPGDIRALCLEATMPYVPAELPPLPETKEEIAVRVAQRQSMAPKFHDLAAMLRGNIPWPSQ